jgi:hypothetical protein
VPTIPPPPTLPAKKKADKLVTVRCNRVEALAKFIADLRIAEESSCASGGLYSAFLKLKDDQVLQVEIGITK